MDRATGTSMRLLALISIVVAFLSVQSISAQPASRALAAPQKAEPASSIDIPSERYFGPYDEVWRVPIKRKDIALTFDDGPYPFYTHCCCMCWSDPMFMRPSL
jgi:peptidoglycan/xylan/chitin deacetylase (PgdA/CDA1 family)